VISQTVNNALRTAPNTDVTMALIRKRYPTLVMSPDMPPDQIREAIAALVPPPPPPPPPPDPVLATIPVSVDCVMTEQRSRIEKYKVDYCFDETVDVPVDIVNDGEEAIGQWIHDWWCQNYYEMTHESDQYDGECCSDDTLDSYITSMSIDTDQAAEDYEEEHGDDDE